MKLSDYSCERISFEFEIPFQMKIWDDVFSFFQPKAADSNRTRKVVAIRGVMVPRDKNVDFHYHFSARKISEGKRKKLAFEIDLVLGSLKGILSKKHPKVRKIESLEAWLSRIVGDTRELLALNIHWRAGFKFSKRKFEPIFELPFKHSLNIPDQEAVLGDLSISGLKVDFEKSTAGLSKIYIEAFPAFISVISVFLQKVSFDEKMVKNFIMGAEKIARLFVRKKGE